MLRKAAIREGKDWDKLIPYLLFAYREVEQASTGLSPFQLVYGWPVRGPVDVLTEPKESPDNSRKAPENVGAGHGEPPKAMVLQESTTTRIQ